MAYVNPFPTSAPAAVGLQAAQQPAPAVSTPSGALAGGPASAAPSGGLYDAILKGLGNSPRGNWWSGFAGQGAGGPPAGFKWSWKSVPQGGLPEWFEGVVGDVGKLVAAGTLNQADKTRIYQHYVEGKNVQPQWQAADV